MFFGYTKKFDGTWKPTKMVTRPSKPPEGSAPKVLGLIELTEEQAIMSLSHLEFKFPLPAEAMPKGRRPLLRHENVEQFIRTVLSDMVISEGLPLSLEDTEAVQYASKLLRAFMADQLVLEKMIFDMLDAKGLMGSGLHDVEEAFELSKAGAEYLRSRAVDHEGVTYPPEAV